MGAGVPGPHTKEIRPGGYPYLSFLLSMAMTHEKMESEELKLKVQSGHTHQQRQQIVEGNKASLGAKHLILVPAVPPSSTCSLEAQEPRPQIRNHRFWQVSSSCSSTLAQGPGPLSKDPRLFPIIHNHLLEPDTVPPPTHQES